MRVHFAVGIVAAILSVHSFAQDAAISQRDACAKFSDAVISVDGGGESRGSGFIVSPNGYILTASHVVMDTDGSYYRAIFVRLPRGDLELAAPVPASFDTVGQDFALLKVNVKETLPYLRLGSIDEVAVGGDATIIGFPFSAISPSNESISKKFCLQASFAATDIVTRDVAGTQQTRTGLVPLKKKVSVDIIYFQGPSVKGISGSPIISRDTGNVVGIVSTKLTGIGPALEGLEEFTGQPQSGGVFLAGVNPNAAFNQITTVLDQQLANGLGSAVGIDDPKEALKRAQKTR